MKKTTLIGLLGFIFLFLAVQFIIGTSFISGPSITNTTTDQNLVCSWNITGPIIQLNISWYNGTTLYRKNTVSNSSTVDVIVPYIHEKGNVWNCTVTIWNGTHNIFASTKTTIRNAAPEPIVVYDMTWNNIGNATTILEDTFYWFKVSSSDPDGDAIDYDAAFEPTGAVITSAGNFTWTPTYLQNGTNLVRFSATDSDAAPKTANLWINFTVQLVNDEPQFVNLADKTATQGETFIFVLQISDEELNYPITFNLTTTNPNITIDPNSDGYTANITFNNNPPTYGDRGNWTVYINISDSLLANNSGSFNLEVIGVNTPPNISAQSDFNGTQGDNIFIWVNGTDIDGGNVTFGINDTYYSFTTLDNNASKASAYINVSPSNNSHVIRRYIKVSISDGSETVYKNIFINLTNTNDPPRIYNQSYYASNSMGSNNIYMYNLSAYANVAFSYRVNGSDPDLYTYASDTLVYSTNDSNFLINATTGIMSFTKNETWIGTHLILVTLTDTNGSNYSSLLNLTMINNTLPYFNQSINNRTCFEDITCTIKVNGTDDDGDSISFVDNSTLFVINNATGLISFSPNQTVIGTYAIKITITDAKGAYAQETFWLTINNTNDPPMLDTIYFGTVVEGHPHSHLITASDQDLLLPLALQYDSLTFNSFNLSNWTLFNITTDGWINFTPNSSHVGNHTYNVSVIDSLGLQDSVLLVFEVFQRSLPPNISQIYPYGTPVSNATTVFGWYARSSFSNNRTTLNNLTENRTIVFNHTTTDDFTAQENLTFIWYINGTLADSTELSSDNHTYSHYFNFFSSGSHNITLRVFDDMFENASFTWLPTITNVNRAPILYNNPSNVSVDQTTSYNDWFSFFDSESKLIDPDDDVNENGYIDGAETNSLTYSISSCSQATLTIENTDTLKVIPEQIGTCYTRVNATDGTYSVESGQIAIVITDVPEQTEVSVSSGGGGSSTQTITIPIPEEVEVPFPLEIVIPEQITIYEDQTILIPIQLRNNWDQPLQGISLGVSYNVTNVTYEFGDDYFDLILPNGLANTTLTLFNYRLGENFEVTIMANVTDPKSNDTAVVLINSIEKASKGEATKIKVVYAQDLLDSNPECQELNEILEKSIRAVEAQNYDEATKLIDAVIQGCKYLVEIQKEKKVESPKNWKTFFLFGNEIPTLVAIGIGVILIGLILTAIFSRGVKHEPVKREGKKIKY